MSRIILFIALAMIPIMAFTQEFKTFKAKQALKKYKSDLKKIEKQKAQADANYKKSLKTAMSAAMKSENLDEAMLIKKILADNAPPEDKRSKLKSKKKYPKGTIKMNGKRYWFSDNKLNYLDSVKKAKDMRGTLLFIYSQKEQRAIEPHLKGHTWLDFNDIKKEGEWLVGGKVRSTYTNWLSHEPSNSGTGEDGAIITEPKTKHRGKWGDNKIENLHYYCVVWK